MQQRRRTVTAVIRKIRALTHPGTVGRKILAVTIQDMETTAVTVLTNMMSMVTILVMVETITETKNTDKNTIKAAVLAFCQSLDKLEEKAG